MLGCHRGSYQGFVRFMFQRPDGGAINSKLLYYTHGSGGSAPVTRGVIKETGEMQQYSQIFFVSGHIHNEWVVTVPMVKVSQQGNIKKQTNSRLFRVLQRR